MAKTSMKLKAQRAPKYKVQQHNRGTACSEVQGTAAQPLQDLR